MFLGKLLCLFDIFAQLQPIGLEIFSVIPDT